MKLEVFFWLALNFLNICHGEYEYCTNRNCNVHLKIYL